MDLIPEDFSKTAELMLSICRELLRERRMTDLHFGATGYCQGKAGRDEVAVRKYIREQEERDRQQSKLFE